MVYYREEEWYLRSKDWINILKNATSQPEQFLGQFSSDLEFCDAAYATVPSMVQNAFGKKRERLLVLLTFKNTQPLALRRFVAAQCAAYVWKDPEKALYALDMFDQKGVSRGLVNLDFGSVATDVAERMRAQILGGISFTERSQIPREGEKTSKQ